jgi:hypothetical protein
VDGAQKRPRDGQIGPEAHFRKPFDPDDASFDTYEYEIPEGSVCDHCCSQLERVPGKDRRQDMEAREEVPVSKQTHEVLAYKCQKCGKSHFGAPPLQVTYSPSSPLYINVCRLKKGKACYQALRVNP